MDSTLDVHPVAASAASPGLLEPFGSGGNASGLAKPDPRRSLGQAFESQEFWSNQNGIQ
jgi:hypothetical protein